jgi:hypothetical protein
MAGIMLGREEETTRPLLKTAAKAVKHLDSKSAF